MSLDSRQQSLIERRPPSVAHHFLSRIAETPDSEAYRFPVAVGDQGAEEWHTLTWGQTAQRVKEVAAGLMTLGIQAEDRVAIASSTRIDWVVADLGNMCAGAATTTVYPSTNAEETAFILADSGSRALFAEDAEQLAKVLARKDELPELFAVIVFDAPAELSDAEGLTVLTMAELRERGTAYLADHPKAIEEAVEALDRHQLATLIYTSGTTGRPKGVRLVHDCWAYEGIAQELSGMLRAEDVQFMWLPMSHVFGKTMLCGQIVTGHSMAVDGRVDRLVENLPIVRPTLMAAVPRIFEKVYNGIASKARAKGGVSYKIFRWAAGVAREYARTTQANEIATGRPTAPLGLRLQHALADKLVFAKVRAAFGGRMRGAVSGSAALAPEIGYFFVGAGLPVLEGYGLTETAAGSTVNREGAVRVGTVGTPLPGTEARIAEDGEILLRGPGVMSGYHNLPEQTAEVLTSDGWFHTGDIGELDSDGFLRITDRKKDMFKTSGGKYVAPSEIEGKFKAICPFVSNILVIGAQRNYCTALIGLDTTVLMPWAAENGMADKSYAEVVAAPATVDLIDGFVRKLNEELQRWQTIKKFTLLPRDLDLEHGEITPSLKIKRPVVERGYAGAIAEMYAGANEA
ncbi:long-chain fatty acid--CoA ligase [Streptomyces sp. NA04227]|uniref:AMP-dependent synthetase/ligase n=1 Tax=Streptomyces sp. NA04227 TaxID=2742136 RepID=UPI00158FE49B|nr:long-chain fatty acid--CoA ligase [Streptomyces sp. NA04227]QKW10381.1 long-chain fatty acid--CoA ligase [Streptomyces sp. NA04227]